MTALHLHPPVRAGQRLTPAQLRDTARDLLDGSGLTQAQVAERIGSSQPSVGAALGSDFEARAGVVASVVEALDPRYELVREVDVRYRVVRKA